MTMPTPALLVGDCRAVMAELDPDSIDAVITDPPYGLEFMGEDWDTFATAQRAPSTAGRVGAGAIDVGAGITDRDAAKVGGARVSYGGKRHRTSRCQTCGRRDQFRNPHGCPDDWASEFITEGGALPGLIEFQRWTTAWATAAYRVLKPGGYLLAFGGARTFHRATVGIEDAGFDVRHVLAWLYGTGFPKSHNLDGAWDGWGTALKPGWEPIIMARKPFPRTVAANLDLHGVGGLHIDAARLDWADSSDEAEAKAKNRHADFGSGERRNHVYGADHVARADHGNYDADGRWPPDVILDPTAATDLGDAARFFYCPKPTTAERNAGGVTNEHPTVKPIEAMRWLIRLTTTPDAEILDPFLGSGTTGMAALLEGRRFTGIERNAEYLTAYAEPRIRWVLDGGRPERLAGTSSTTPTAPSLFDEEA